MRAFLTWLFLFAFTFSFSQTPPADQLTAAKLAQGDIVIVKVLGAPNASGEFQVLTDGSITGTSFGRVLVLGKTISEVEKLLTTTLKKRMIDPVVSVYFKVQRVPVAYVINLVGTVATGAPSGIANETSSRVGGTVPITIGFNLRKLIAAVTLSHAPDQLLVNLTRGGKQLVDAKLADVLKLNSEPGATLIEAEDVVTISLQPYVRIWMTGSVARPGQLIVQEGTNVYQAIAEAGGVGGLADLDYDIVVRRGPESKTFPARQNPSIAVDKLEAGDTVVVQQKVMIRVTINGEVSSPAEIALRNDPTVLGAIAKAGGINSQGTLRNILVLRKGEVFKLDLSPILKTDKPTDFALEDGDFVYVRKNERFFSVLGSVGHSGSFQMEDSKKYTALDALAVAGGIGSGGTLRRVFLARANDKGKVVVTEFNLDEFIKSGKTASNPDILPDDILLFGNAKSLTINDVSQLVSPIVLLETILRRR